MIVRVGCCGWCVKGGKKEYFKEFSTIEVQETFYKLPRVETVKKWREDAPVEFIFNMKAWQVVTHPPGSPTWRRSGLKIPKSKVNSYGYLKPTQENIEAWNKILEVAEGLNAKVIVVQTPASFNYSKENVKNIEEFFSIVERCRCIIGWEPRGDWREHLSEVKRLCSKLDILHITDPFRSENVSDHLIGYFRLHGIGGREVNYSYRYTIDDLYKLLENIRREREKGREEVYVMFNNVSMRDDAANFKKLLLKTL
ncbi:MAG: DUF72 domain-containing protein [Aigarchaeota archaeon]|nr:DUF72 domain-containing protein [Aigarchaeota archaeon]MCX8193260.1 DUF72 domain-containing protein [Nitrososphaeria archaeon]MDW7986899.1 DUF72 domain-containing protein [Nitrososphaerota archaeon]